MQIEDSVIKGYHEYKIAPPLALELVLQPEYVNIHDKDAILVWMPQIKDDKILKQKTSQGLYVKDLVNPVPLIIGHVPRGLAAIFRQFLDEKYFLTCVATGKPIPSFSPWPHPSEIGGGVVIPCKYKIYCEPNQIGDVISRVKNILPIVKGGDAMKLSIA